MPIFGGASSSLTRRLLWPSALSQASSAQSCTTSGTRPATSCSVVQALLGLADSSPAWPRSSGLHCAIGFHCCNFSTPAALPQHSDTLLDASAVLLPAMVIMGFQHLCRGE